MCLLIILQSRVKWGQTYLNYFSSKNRGHNCHKKGGKGRLNRQKQETISIVHGTRVKFDDWKWKWSCSVMSDSLRSHGLLSPRLLCPRDFPGKSIGVGCNFLLQGIFLTQGSNPGLLLCRQMLYPLSHQGSPKLDDYVAVIIFKRNFIS